MLSTLTIFISFHPYDIPMRLVLLFPLLYRWEKCSLEMLSPSPKVTQLNSGWTLRWISESLILTTSPNYISARTWVVWHLFYCFQFLNLKNSFLLFPCKSDFSPSRNYRSAKMARTLTCNLPVSTRISCLLHVLPHFSPSRGTFPLWVWHVERMRHLSRLIWVERVLQPWSSTSCAGFHSTFIEESREWWTWEMHALLVDLRRGGCCGDRLWKRPSLQTLCRLFSPKMLSCSS